MLDANKRRDLLATADAAAHELRNAGASRTEVSPVTNVLLRAPEPWPQRRQKARQLSSMLHESWLANRGKQMPARLSKVGEILGRLIDAQPAEEEASYLFGWLLRRVHTEARLSEREEREKKWSAGGGRG